jgi:dTDP-glucose 4,6-dehydratase
VGPYLPLDAHYAIGNFIRDALNGHSIGVTGDGTPFRSYLYAADLAAWLWTILLQPSATGAYNVGSDEAWPIREIAKRVALSCPSRPGVTLAHSPDLRRAPSRYVPNVDRARRELGLEVWTPLDVAIRKTFDFHQPNWRTQP